MAEHPRGTAELVIGTWKIEVMTQVFKIMIQKMGLVEQTVERKV